MIISLLSLLLLFFYCLALFNYMSINKKDCVLSRSSSFELFGYDFMVSEEFTTLYCSILYYIVSYSSSVQYSIVYYSIVQYKILYCTILQFSIVQYNIVQYGIIQYSIVQYSVVQYSMLQYRLVQYMLAFGYDFMVSEEL